MTKMLANMKIGRKLALLLGGGIVQVLAVGALSLWALHSMQNAVRETEEENAKMMLIQRAGSATASAANLVGGIVISPEVTPEALAQVAAVRKTYLAMFSDLRGRDTTKEGRRIVEEAEQVAGRWREVNVRVLDLKKAGKGTEAMDAYREISIPHFTELEGELAKYIKYQEERLADTKKAADAVSARMPILVMLMVGLSLGTALLLGTSVSRSIARPLAAAVDSIGNIAKGDISKDVSEEFAVREDEFGEMSRAVRTMSQNLRQVIKDIAGGVHVLSASSAELAASSGQMSNGSRNASEKAHAVAAAAEEMSTNAVSVAAGMEQTSTNLAHVTTSTEQMTATITEIAGNSEKARRITNEANRQAVSITEQMNQLGQAAHEIGKVTETITEISSQTNLLALNATIEAARAGAAGKGFAVVANEIKELAQQTAAATEDIKARIAGVQSSTSSGISEIERISQVIHEVSDIVTSIATAIEEQAAATKDISRNIGEATTGVVDANGRVAQTSQATQEIAKEISGVDQVAREMAENSEQVKASSTELSKVAEQLKAAVARFHV